MLQNATTLAIVAVHSADNEPPSVSKMWTFGHSLPLTSAKSAWIALQILGALMVGVGLEHERVAPARAGREQRRHVRHVAEIAERHLAARLLFQIFRLL